MRARKISSNSPRSISTRERRYSGSMTPPTTPGEITSLADTIRSFEEIADGKWDHLPETAFMYVGAIEQAEEVVSQGGEPDWEPFRKVIEVIQMQTRKDWMKKYYTEEQLTNLRERWTPEVQAESQRGWAELVRDTEAAIARGEDPLGETGQQLAERRQKLLDQFTGGDPGMEANLQKLYADKSNWPESFKKPYSDAVDNFLCQAAEGMVKTTAR